MSEITTNHAQIPDNWPDCFYEETDPALRRRLLEAHMALYTEETGQEDAMAKAVVARVESEAADDEPFMADAQMVDSEPNKTEPVMTESIVDIVGSKAADIIRLNLLNKRYSSEQPGKKNLPNIKKEEARSIEESEQGKTIDLFTRTWMLMKISADQGTGFLQKNRIRKEWMKYMEVLGINKNQEAAARQNESLYLEHQLLLAEWRAFFQQYIKSCVSDKIYGSTLFGIMPLKEDSVSNKIAAELEQVTRIFPEKLGLEEEFREFHDCAIRSFESLRKSLIQ